MFLLMKQAYSLSLICLFIAFSSIAEASKTHSYDFKDDWRHQNSKKYDLKQAQIISDLDSKKSCQNKDARESISLPPLVFTPKQKIDYSHPFILLSNLLFLQQSISTVVNSLPNTSNNQKLQLQSFSQVTSIHNQVATIPHITVRGLPGDSKDQKKNHPSDQVIQTISKKLETVEEVKQFLTDQLKIKITEDANLDSNGVYSRTGKEEFISMKPTKVFESEGEKNPDAFYIKVLLHEVIHWTGHESLRLNRAKASSRSENPILYAREEITAEIGSLLLREALGFKLVDSDRFPSFDYIEHFLREIPSGDRESALSDAYQRAKEAISYIKKLTPDYSYSANDYGFLELSGNIRRPLKK